MTGKTRRAPTADKRSASPIRAALMLAMVLTLPPQAPADEPVDGLTATADRALASSDPHTAVRALERLRYQGAISQAQRLQLAEAYLSLRRLDDAAAEAERIDPETGGTRLLLVKARLAALEADWTRVRDLSLEVIAREPTHAGAYLQLGQALMELGDAAAADAAFATYAELTR